MDFKNNLENSLDRYDPTALLKEVVDVQDSFYSNAKAMLKKTVEKSLHGFTENLCKRSNCNDRFPDYMIHNGVKKRRHDIIWCLSHCSQAPCSNKKKYNPSEVIENNKAEIYDSKDSSLPSKTKEGNVKYDTKK